jgi:hypothetical protein
MGAGDFRRGDDIAGESGTGDTEQKKNRSAPEYRRKRGRSAGISAGGCRKQGFQGLSGPSVQLRSCRIKTGLDKIARWNRTRMRRVPEPKSPAHRNTRRRRRDLLARLIAAKRHWGRGLFPGLILSRSSAEMEPDTGTFCGIGTRILDDVVCLQAWILKA